MSLTKIANNVFNVVGAACIGVNLTAGFAQAQSNSSLSFYNTHTEETVRANPNTRAGRAAINSILRDHRRNEAVVMDTELLDLLRDMQASLLARDPNRPIVFHVISGYRSQQTNNALRRNGGGQARNSRHSHGDAIDIRVPGVSLRELRSVAWCLQRGGVGSYARDNFVHVDTHRSRVRDSRFPGGVRFRAWGWSPSPNQCRG
jgi:uncharacterized protein YcbK (DUF882 family)